MLCSLLLTLHLFRLSGEKGTLAHGSVVDGRFEGFIKTHQGTYYVEPSERYLQDKDAPFHSVIYHEEDIGKCASFRESKCDIIYKETKKRISEALCLSLYICVCVIMF